MARAGKAKDPDAEMAALHQKRVGIAAKRHELSAAVGAAERVVAGSGDRRGTAVRARVHDEEHAETPEQVDLARRQAEVAVVDGREEADVLRKDEADIEEEVEALIDAHPQHFIARAEAASEAASGAAAAAAEAASAAVVSCGEARAAWGVVRRSRGRRRLDLSPEVPVSDLGAAVSELAKAQGSAWPGGSRERWESFLAHDGAPKVKVSNAEALARFAGNR
jgi:hypothetical protein